MNGLRSHIKNSKECFIMYPNTSKSVKKTRLRLVFSTHFSGFGYPDETLFLVFDILHKIFSFYNGHLLVSRELKTVGPYLDMELAVDSFPLVIHQLKRVTSISIHVLVSIRNTAITKQEAHLMSGLRTQSDEVPEHIRVLHEKNPDFMYCTLKYVSALYTCTYLYYSLID